MVALAGSMLVSAANAPVRLVGVSMQDNAVLIESTEPVAYAVSRPDPLTLLVDLRNVRVGDAAQRGRRDGRARGQAGTGRGRRRRGAGARAACR